MQIQCTSCKAIARISDDKEGAKVRCPSCKHVFVARPAGTRHSSTRAKADNSKLMIFGGVGLVGAIGLAVIMSGGKSSPPASTDLPDVPEEVAYVDPTGWDSPLVKVARSLHESAHKQNRYKLQRLLVIDRIYARVESTEEHQFTPGDWTALSDIEQTTFEEGFITSLLEASPENLVTSWEPLNGEVLAEDSTSATVRITLEPRDASLGVQTRSVDWHFIKENEKWKAWSWERWISPAEKRGQRVSRSSKVKKVTLDDGSKVFEAEPAPLDWMSETTAEERAKIEGLIATVCAPDTRGSALFAARQELVLICKPAIPPLLTQFYELDLAGFDTYENQTAGMQVHQVLTEITGYATTFKAHEALGATDQRRSSGVKQWFSWYHRHFRRFECDAASEEEEDTLFEPLNERERRDLERARREAENG